MTPHFEGSLLLLRFIFDYMMLNNMACADLHLFPPGALTYIPPLLQFLKCTMSSLWAFVHTLLPIGLISPCASGHNIDSLKEPALTPSTTTIIRSGFSSPLLCS